MKDIFKTAPFSVIKVVTFTYMVHVAILKNKKDIKKECKIVQDGLSELKARNLKWDSLADKALKHVKKHNLKIHDKVFYQKMIKEWKK